ALRITGAARPDVVVLDLQLPDMSGVEVTRGLRAAHPAVRVLVLSASGEQQDVLDAVKAGAVGYLLKSAARPEFRDRGRCDCWRNGTGEPGGQPVGSQRPGGDVGPHPARVAGERVAEAGRVGPGPLPGRVGAHHEHRAHRLDLRLGAGGRAEVL